MLNIWKIGDVLIPNRVVLAPMAGVTDKAFRLIAREFGCGLIYTEMISAKALTYNNHRTHTLLDLTGEKGPIAVQLFGSEPAVMAEGAGIAVEQGASLVDINMGCPVPKVVKNGEGSALLEKPELAQKIVAAMVQAVDVPVTVKIRIGWDSAHILAVEFAGRMEAAGAAAVAVHGRTRDQYYAGRANWEAIRDVKKALSVPVIGNGDIWEPADAARMLETTGCDAVMIGRGAMGNPWLLGRTWRHLRGVETGAPKARDKILGAIRHLDLTLALKGEDVGIREMRKHLAWYLKGLPHTAVLKEALFRVKEREQAVSLLTEYLLRLEQEIEPNIAVRE